MIQTAKRTGLMTMTFRTSEAGKALIKEFEKCELKAYADATSGNPVIGWGQENWLFPNTPGAIRVTLEPRLEITQKQADDAFEFFVHNVTDPLVWKHFNCQTQAEHDACAAWVYNVKTGRLERGEYTLPSVFNKRPRDLQEIITWWIKYKNPNTNTEQGLYRRRLAELCLMNEWPHRFAWTATLRRAGEPGDKHAGPIVEMTDPHYILGLAEAAKPIPSEPDPPKAPEPVKPVEAAPIPEVSPVDPTLPPKKIEDSKTGKAVNRQSRGRETVTVGTVGTTVAIVASQVEIVGKTLESLQPGTLLLITAMGFVGLIGFGGYMWWSGRNEAYMRRLEQQDPKY